MSLRLFAVAALLCLSGLSALVFQVAWFRELRLVFGASTAASAAVLAIFMGGLGLGNALLGPRADASPQPLKFYARLVGGIGILGGLSPFCIDGIRAIYVALGGQLTLGMTAATLLRLGLATLVLGLPTFLMGGTMPAAARIVTLPGDTQRRGLALFYGLNTLGSVAGALWSTFYLLEAFGTRATLGIACGVDLLSATAASLLAEYAFGNDPVSTASALARPASQSTPRSASGPVKTTRGAIPDGPQTGGAGVIYTAAGCVGFAFFVMELVWYRMLGPLLGGSTFTFGLILAVALAGIGLGGAVYPLWSRWLRPSRGTFALTCALEAACLAFPFALGDQIAVWALFLRDAGSATFAGHIWDWTLIAGSVVFPAAFISGIQFPVLIALLGEGNDHVGQQVGRAFAANTLGAILGSLVGGFGILPLLTAPGTWRAVVWLLIMLGAAALILSRREERRWFRLVLPLGCAALAGWWISAEGPTAVWRHTPIGAGRAQLADHTPNGIHDWMNAQRRKIIWEAEGVESSVAISADHGLSFVVNGKADGNAVLDVGTQIMLGMLGATLHPEPKSSFVVGLGTGESAGWLAAVPSMQRVDVAELEPAVDEMARRCRVLNQDVLNRPNVRMIYNDAREVLLTAPERYDLIVSEPSNPYRAGIASLFTREFYAACSSRMQPGGIFVQWLQAYEIDEQTVATVCATLRAVFPHVEVWQSRTDDMLLVCSAAPLAWEATALRERLRQPIHAEAVAHAWRATDLEGFLSHFVAGPAAVDALVPADAAINTDDQNHVEYGFARSLGRQGGFTVPRLRSNAVALGSGRAAVNGDVQWDLVDDHRQINFAILEGTLLELPQSTPVQAARHAALGAYLNGDLQGTITAWESLPREAVFPTETAAIALAYADLGNPRAHPLIEQLRGFQPVEADAIEALLAVRQGDPARATDLLLQTWAGLRRDPWPLPQLVEHALYLWRDIVQAAPARAAALEPGLSEPFAMFLFEDDRKSNAFELSLGLGPQALAPVIEAYEPHVPWTELFLNVRAHTYAATRHSREEQARRDLEEFVRASVPAAR